MSVTVTFGKRSFTFSNHSADNQLFTRLRQSEQFYHVRTSKVSVSFYLIACFSRPVTCIQAMNTSKWQFWKSGFRLSISFSVAKYWWPEGWCWWSCDVSQTCNVFLLGEKKSDVLEQNYFKLVCFAGWRFRVHFSCRFWNWSLLPWKDSPSCCALFHRGSYRGWW